MTRVLPPDRRFLGRWTVGRDADCDIVIPQSTVSQRHCLIEMESDGTLYAEDLGSRNGTHVDGVRVSGRTRLTPQSRVSAGPADPIDLTRLVGQRTMGRDPVCDVHVDEAGVSALHARLVVAAAGCWVEDLGAANGTFLNGARVTGLRRVLVGDRIGVGTVELEVTADWNLAIVERPRLSVEASGVSVSTRKVRLLENVSFAIPAGSLCGILGPSGAGKSVLLAVLNGSQRPTRGEVRVGGQSLYAHPAHFAQLIGFVPQDDIMHRELTVREALMLAGRLRLGSEYGIRDVQSRVDEVVTTLGLEGTLDVVIGSPERRGISGGQRKRVNIALELLTDPPVLLLDEPTSGLSSSDALSMFNLLESLAAQGKTVILVVHQPSDELFLKLTHVVVMVREAIGDTAVGRLAYFGGREAIKSELLARRAPRPLATLADSVLEAALSLPPRPPGEEATHVTAGIESLPSSAAPVRPATYLTQLLALLVRSIHVKRRDLPQMIVLLAQGPVIGGLVALAFGDAEGEQLHAVPLFLLALAAVWFGCSNAAREIVGETAIFLRERMSGLSILAYGASKVLMLLPLCALQCAALWSVVSLGCDLRNPVQGFAFLLLASTVGMMLGLFVSAFCRTTEAAISLVPLLLIPMVILGGLLRPLHELPRPLRALSAVTPTRWTFEGLLLSNSVERLARLPEAEAAPLRAERDRLMRPRDRVGRLGASLRLLAMGMGLLVAILFVLSRRTPA